VHLRVSRALKRTLQDSCEAVGENVYVDYLEIQEVKAKEEMTMARFLGVISLFFVVLSSGVCLPQEEQGMATQFRYSCVRFDQNRSEIVFQGKLDPEKFQMLFRDACLANYEQVEIPKSASVFGVFAIADGNEIMVMPLYTWKQGKNTYCACRFETAETVLSPAFQAVGDKDRFLKTLARRITTQYNSVEEITWDPNCLKTESVAISIGKWARPDTQSDTQLVLYLDKLRFVEGESIHVRVHLVNSGKKCLTIPGILPNRSSANPPTIEIRNAGGEMALNQDGAGIPKEILNDKEIVIHSGKGIVVLDADLTNIHCFVLSGLTPNGWSKTEEVSSLCSWLRPGDYTISAGFFPMILSLKTQELRFRIEAR
jgi:hypothetical protein